MGGVLSFQWAAWRARCGSFQNVTPLETSNYNTECPRHVAKQDTTVTINCTVRWKKPGIFLFISELEQSGNVSPGQVVHAAVTFS